MESKKYTSNCDSSFSPEVRNNENGILLPQVTSNCFVKIWVGNAEFSLWARLIIYFFMRIRNSTPCWLLRTNLPISSDKFGFKNLISLPLFSVLLQHLFNLILIEHRKVLTWSNRSSFYCTGHLHHAYKGTYRIFQDRYNYIQKNLMS